jgi:hypothetical protein
MTISNKDMIVDDEHLLNGKTWLDLKIEAVYLPTESWAKLKTYIISQCKKHSDCTKEVGDWNRKLEYVTP